MPSPLKAQCWIFSSWTLTEYKGTVHSLYTHVYSLIFQIPIPSRAAHVSGKFLFFPTVKTKAFSTVRQVLCFCSSSPPLPRSFCQRYIDLLLFLKLSKPLGLCLESIFPKLGQGSLPLSLQVSAQMVSYPRGFPPSSYMKLPPDPSSVLYPLPCSVQHEITSCITHPLAYCCHPHHPFR